MAPDSFLGTMSPFFWATPSPKPYFSSPSASQAAPLADLEPVGVGLGLSFDFDSSSQLDISDTPFTLGSSSAAGRSTPPLFGDGGVADAQNTPPSPFTPATASTLPIPEYSIKKSDSSKDYGFELGPSGLSDGEEDDEETYQRYLHGFSSEDFVHDPDDDGTRYDLRPGARLVPLSCGATWLDHDTSGNYDPLSKDQWQEQRARRRKRRGRTEIGASEDDAHKVDYVKRPQSYLTARQNGSQYVVTLSLPSERGKIQLKRCPGNVPLDYKYHNFLDDDDVSGYSSSADTPTLTSHLRRSHRQIYRATSVIDPNISLGYPAARGCKACFKHGQPCPLLEPDGVYPCYLCVEDDCDCELVIEPAKKRACERCKKRRIGCSYLENDKHDEPCEDCQLAGYSCVAGPAVDKSRTRIGFNGQPATVHFKDPQYKRAATRSKNTDTAKTPQGRGRYLTCTRCRQEGLRCGLRKVKPELPCRHCAAEGSDCQLKDKTNPTQVLAPPSKSIEKRRMIQGKTRGPFNGLDADAQTHFQRLAAGTKSTFSSSSERTITASPLYRRPHHSRRDSGIVLPEKQPPGKIAIIKSRLAFPLRFNHSTACNWCEDPLYGLFGVGEQDYIKIRIWPDGKGCTELGRQAAFNHLDGSRMCPDCTMSFILVLTCSGHQLRPIRPRPAADADISAVLQAIDDSKAGEARRSLDRQICSICPTLATSQCCTGASECGGCGCGLRFCDTCALLFEQLFDSDLSLMVAKMNGDDDETFPHGLRADYDFYAADSYLVKQLS